MGRIVLTAIVLSACASSNLEVPVREGPVAKQVTAPVAAVGLDTRLSATLDSLVAAGIADGAAPGVALAVGRHGRIVHMRGYGRIEVAPAAAGVTDSTRWDLASLTKVVATTTAAMILEEAGLLNIERPIRDYLPELNAPDKANITVRQLLQHNGGFRSGAPLWRESSDIVGFLRAMNERPLAYNPGDSTVYSDWDLIMTGVIVERITGKPLDVFLQERVWGPLGMRETGFNPLGSNRLASGESCMRMFRTNHPLLPQIAAAEIDTFWRKQLVHGTVHDENACALGGVAGHAGLFSSARDLATYSQMMLNGGEFNGVRILKATTVARWTSRQGRSSRALGWDTPAPRSSSGRYFSPRSFGHTGFTGTSMWLDPEKGLYVVILTNRVNPTRANGKHEPLRRAIADAVQKAVLDAPVVEWNPTPPTTGARVVPGAERLFGEFSELIRDRNVALVSNHSGRLADGTHLADALHRYPNTTLKALFGMEHDIRSNDYSLPRDAEAVLDKTTGVMKYNLYGEHHKPTAEQLKGVDVIVFDIQEVGARFYEHINILGFVMEAAAENNVAVVVLDRPNPITGMKQDGFVTDNAYLYRFGSYTHVPVLHGMTMGELAKFYNDEKLLRGGVTAKLHVVPMQGWRRAMWYDETGLPWTKPSPNLLTLNSLLAYTGTCLFEAVNVSEGRGTDHPFEYIGAPWLDNKGAVALLNDLALRGVVFDAVDFTPEQKPYHGRPPEMTGVLLHGVSVRVTDRNAFEPYKAGVAMLWAMHKLHPDRIEWNDAVLERLTATQRLKTMIKAGATPPQIFASWSGEVAEFASRSARYRLYE